MAILKPINRDLLLPRTLPVTPLNLYLELVKGTTESARAKALGQTYLPAQFGGILGQSQILGDQACIQAIDFSVSGDNQ